MTNEIKLEPNYAMLRARFSDEALFQASTILADLLPEHLIESEHIKRVQLEVLRAFQGVLVPLNVCIQATDTTAAVIEYRQLMDAVSKTIIAKADEIEKAIENEDDDSGDEL